MRRPFLKVNGDSDSRVEDDNVGCEGQEKAGDMWETYIWRQYSNPRPETTRTQEVGETQTQHNENQKHWNTRVDRFPSASVPSGNNTPRRSVCTLNVCMLNQQRSYSHER